MFRNSVTMLSLEEKKSPEETTMQTKLYGLRPELGRTSLSSGHLGDRQEEEEKQIFILSNVPC
jgi:hypothetical protein